MQYIFINIYLYICIREDSKALLTVLQVRQSSFESGRSTLITSLQLQNIMSGKISTNIGGSALAVHVLFQIIVSSSLLFTTNQELHLYSFNSVLTLILSVAVMISCSVSIEKLAFLSSRSRYPGGRCSSSLSSSPFDCSSFSVCSKVTKYQLGWNRTYVIILWLWTGVSCFSNSCLVWNECLIKSSTDWKD